MDDTPGMDMKDSHAQLPRVDPDLLLCKVHPSTSLRRNKLLDITTLRELHYNVQVHLARLWWREVFSDEVAQVLDDVGMSQLL